MLTELRVENFAIIDRLELPLKPGLVTFTGETGAGKSIIIDAVETLLGGRVDSTMIRSGSKNASIEATFQITPEVRENVHAVLKREELLDDPDYFTLGREIRSEGRSVARLNGRTVNVGLLRELGELVVDVHGQSEHLSLLRVREHLGLLDRYAGVEDLLLSYSITYRKLMSVRKEMQELRIAESEAARRIDLLTYQINEIESARLQPGEEEDLRSERTRLANAETLASLSQKALTNLDEGTPEAPSVVDLLGQVMDALHDLARIDPSHSGLADDTQNTFSGLTDLARDLRSYFESIEFNPKRLDEVEERLDLLQNLKRKYGDSIPAILSFANNARQQVETIQGASERLAELADQQTNLLTVLGERGILLSQKRKQAADQLNQEMEAELADLRMSGARFSVDFQQRPDPNGVPLAEGNRIAFDATGLERVEFLIAPNPGGVETSRPNRFRR
jgi:DNA repair protein RecN (Recombination protein N)